MADKASLNGINRYKTIGNLRGCVNDTLSLQKLLIEAFGFKRNAIRIRTDAKVTKTELQKSWDWLLAGAKPGDRLIFHFSGHGSFVNDRDGDESDGVDELLCLHGMDWNDPDTYLLDDELREWSEQIPDGVLVTFLLDNCHSGTATRMIMPPPLSAAAGGLSIQAASLVDVETSFIRLSHMPGRSRAVERSSQSDLVEELVPPSSDQLSESNVVVRFAPPPPQVAQAMQQGGVRTSFRQLHLDKLDAEQNESAGMNHVLWSGSQSDQTSADAFIDGDFHGAFTYYFCETIRKSFSTSNSQHAPNSQNVIAALRQTLQREGFRQVPQLEPEDNDEVVFRSAKKLGEDNEPGDNSDPEPFEPGPLDPGTVGPPADVWLQIVKSLQQIADQLTARTSSSDRDDDANRALVYVHGICVHPPGYSDPWWNSMSRYLSANVRARLNANRHEVLWSRHVSATDRSAVVMSAADQQQQQEMEQRLRDVLRDRATHEVANEIAQSANMGDRAANMGDHPVGLRSIEPAGNMPRAAFGIPGLDCVDDFSKYLASDRIRQLVLDEFTGVLRPLLAGGELVEVISHSWGTVVAYEGLRALEAEGLAGRVHNWFTVGAALSISFVADRLRPGDGRKPTMVDRWINLDAKADFVGGSLQAVGMQVDQEFLNLTPAGCNSFGWPFRLYAPACAHSSYFHPSNRAVNRDVFAASINRTR